MKKITKTTLKKWEACEDGFKRFVELFPKGADLQTASQGLIEDGNPDWSDYLWCACKDDDDYLDQTNVTAGDYGTATAGYHGTAIAGYNGTATAGYNGTATAGNRGTATAGDFGTATAGYNGTATAGDFGTATAGDYGTATAGYHGTAIAGDYGKAAAGNSGTAIAGSCGAIVIEYDNGGHYMKKCAEVDGVKIKADTPYKIIDGEFKEVEK